MAQKSKKKKSKDLYVPFCPKCKYFDVRVDKSNALQETRIGPCVYTCNRCGHTGFNFPETKASAIKGFEKKASMNGMRKKDDDNCEQPDFGNFEVRAAWKTLGPVLAVIGLLGLLWGHSVIAWTLIILGLLMAIITWGPKRSLRD